MSISRWMIISVLFSVVVGLAACATPRQAAEVQHQRALYEAKFLAYRQRCHTMGGRIHVQAHQAQRRGGIPQRGSRYQCF